MDESVHTTVSASQYLDRVNPTEEASSTTATMAVPELLKRAHQAIKNGESSLRRAAEDIAAAHQLGATQRQIADAVGKSSAWVNRLLKWRRNGYADETPFGPEAKAKRARACVQATEQNTGKTIQTGVTASSVTEVDAGRPVKLVDSAVILQLENSSSDNGRLSSEQTQFADVQTEYSNTDAVYSAIVQDDDLDSSSRDLTQFSDDEKRQVADLERAWASLARAWTSATSRVQRHFETKCNAPFAKVSAESSLACIVDANGHHAHGATEGLRS
jgi:hypothetical protein